VYLPGFEYRVRNATDTSEARFVLITIKTVGNQQKDPVSIREFAGCVAILLRVKITSVTNGTARTVKRIKIPDTYAI